MGTTKATVAGRRGTVATAGAAGQCGVAIDAMTGAIIGRHGDVGGNWAARRRGDGDSDDGDEHHVATTVVMRRSEDDDDGGRSLRHGGEIAKVQ
ncbi:hypothetical protein GUJ93_ZPchr0010g7343 [Zizania palustris]|uniref:Uncharacterized protein n=1 Tax=Zizania palustris TaxID=103762 RepID=A0A8J6BI96_ZIZPA|nr:hypothetical protein GUJ93_ZPchr0010g7343 [Zizania palustris]